MTVTTTTARNVKAPNGSTTSFPFDFAFEAEGSLVVNRIVIITGVETLQTLTTDYTVTGGGGATGTIEMVSPPPGPGLETLVIERREVFTQSVDYQRNDPFPAEVNETALDKLTFLVQQVFDLIGRSVKLKKSSLLDGPVIPDPEVGKILVGKTTTEFENKTVSDLDPTVTALPLSVANGGTNAATASAARTNLGAQTQDDDLDDIAALTHTAGHVVESDGTDWTAALPRVEGQCRLTKSGANLQLARLNGIKLTINGVNEIVPATPITLAATGLTIDTDHFIYAFMSGSTMTLEASTTGHATNATTGVEIKSGDATRTLVGMARPVTGPVWVDTAAQRFVRSWFNDQGVTFEGATFTVVTTTSTSFVELSSGKRVEWLNWVTEPLFVHFGGDHSNNTAGIAVISNIGVDDATAEGANCAASSNPGGAATGISVAISLNNLSEGFHEARPLGKVVANTGTYAGQLVGHVGVR